MSTDKIGPQHLRRKAILYVRQSSAHQVLHNRESGALQYAMRDRLTALGFTEIEVIDEDLGRSAAGSVQRSGFERMVAEVCLGKVGAVCAREVSRFARNSRDWQQLIEMCRVVDTVLVDQETILPTPITAKAGPMPTYQRFGSNNHESRKDRREPAIELNEEPAIVVRKTSPTLQLTPQDDQLMSERGILSLQPDL